MCHSLHALPTTQPPLTLTTRPAQAWLTEKQVAMVTALSVSTLRNHRQKRIGIPYAKIGRAVRYSSRAVEEYMNAQAIKY